MNMATKNNILEQYQDEYYGATKDRKSQILDAVTEVAKMHRKAGVPKTCTQNGSVAVNLTSPHQP